MRRRVASALSVLLLVAGLVQGGRGAWIYAKAEFAQILLRRSWADTRAGRERVRPWPWADAWPVARIILPDGDHIVLGGASGRNLAFAPGHLDGTALPGGGGTCVIAGHRDTHFAILEDLVEGDRVQLEDASGIVSSYRVAASAVVDESETDVLAETTGPSLVLITCWPFHSVNPGGPLRYVVWAEKDSTVSGPTHTAAGTAAPRSFDQL
jgi:sortase A